MEKCKHNKNGEGLCWGCKANRKAAYDLTGTHDSVEQKQYWNNVWSEVRRLRRNQFKRRLQGK